MIMKLEVVAMMMLIIWPNWKCVQGAKMLLVPDDHPSHVNLFSVMARILSQAGNDVTVLSFPRHQEAVERVGVKAIIYPTTVPVIMSNTEQRTKLLTEGSGDMIEIFSNFSESSVRQWRQIYEDPDFENQITDAKFDLMIMDGMEFARAAYVLPYRHGVRYMTVHARHVPWPARVSALPTGEGIHGIFLFDDPYSSTFLERVKSLFLYIYMYLRSPTKEITDELVSTYAPTRPVASMSDLYQGSEMFIVKLDTYCLDFPLVNAPHYVFLGGLGLVDAKPLDKEFEYFIKDAEHGVIIVTFRSALSKLPMDTLVKMLSAFSQVKQKVIMRYDGKKPKHLPRNVKLSKWLPQNDLLAHPKTRLFVDHGGNNGQIEALYHGVPMVTIPVFGDQFYNAKRSEVRGYVKTVNFHSLSTAKLLTAIMETINNPIYKNNIANCSAKFRHLSNRDKLLAFWVDHVNTFGGQHLKPTYRKMPMWKFFGLDILIVLGGSLLVCIHLTKFAVVTVVLFLLARIKRILPLSPAKGKSE